MKLEWYWSPGLEAVTTQRTGPHRVTCEEHLVEHTVPREGLPYAWTSVAPPFLLQVLIKHRVRARTVLVTCPNPRVTGY